MICTVQNNSSLSNRIWFSGLPKTHKYQCLVLSFISPTSCTDVIEQIHLFSLIAKRLPYHAYASRENKVAWLVIEGVLEYMTEKEPKDIKRNGNCPLNKTSKSEKIYQLQTIGSCEVRIEAQRSWTSIGYC